MPGMEASITQLIEQAADRLRGVQRACCMTGAGVSAESGVPTFRGPGGLWEGRRAEALATPDAFAADPKTVWRFYAWRRGFLKNCQPNPGHYALARMEEMIPDFTLVTQNVDGLHRQAGSRNLFALHGDIWIDRCPKCSRQQRNSGDDLEMIPHCPACGAMMRPGVVWFGEILPPEALERSHRACANCEVLLVVGTSSQVYPAAGLSDVARHNGATVIEINPEATPLTHAADLAIPAPSGQALPAIVDRLASGPG